MKISLNKFFILSLIYWSILPIIKIGSYSMPVLYLLLPIQLFVIVLALLNLIKTPNIIKDCMIFFIIICAEIIISAFIATITKLGHFEFPTDILQYVARFSVLIFSSTLFYNKSINGDFFVKHFLIAQNLGMLIGIMQWIPWAGRSFFVKLYPYRDGTLQLTHLNRTSLTGIRVHGLAQHATSNGGLATFFFIFALIMLIYYKKHKLLSVLVIITSLINVFASQARAGLLALVFSIFLIYFVDIYIYKKGFKTALKFFPLIIIGSLIFLFFYLTENPILLQLLNRFDTLFVEDGGGSIRLTQFEYFKSLFNNSLDYVFGLSKPIVNISAIPYGIEIEPLNIYVLYGVLGFILQYSFIVYVCIYLLKSMRLFSNKPIVISFISATFVGLISYQVFSVGYRFFRDTNVGLFPWILLGVTIGILEREKRKEH